MSQLEIVKKLVKLGADVNSKGKLGDTPLHVAFKPLVSGSSYLEIMDFLVKKGADVNIRNDYDKTPKDLADESDEFVKIKKIFEK